jgi:hypothetical protein
MTTRVHRPTILELVWANAQIEARFPDFPEIATSDDRYCCGVDEVASRYGWGDATEAWWTYDGNCFLLGY